MSDSIKSVLKAIESLAKRIDAIEQRIGGGDSGKQPTVWELTKIMEAKDKESQDFKNLHSSEVAMGIQWDDMDSREQYIKMRREVRKISNQIGSMA